jgi:hypothetical protein
MQNIIKLKEEGEASSRRKMMLERGSVEMKK